MINKITFKKTKSFIFILTVKEIERLRSPIGLDIGSRTPEETAISIVAEIIALRTGRSSTSLSETHGPIHD